MPLPTSYTEDTLAAYMRDDVLKATGQVLGLTQLAQFSDAVLEVAASLGYEIASISDMRRLRAVARREAWRVALSQAGGDYQYTEDGVTNNRQQIFDHCKIMFEQAEGEAAALGPIETPDTGTVHPSRGSFAVPNTPVW